MQAIAPTLQIPLKTQVWKANASSSPSLLIWAVRRRVQPEDPPGTSRVPPRDGRADSRIVHTPGPHCAGQGRSPKGSWLVLGKGQVKQCPLPLGGEELRKVTVYRERIRRRAFGQSGQWGQRFGGYTVCEQYVLLSAWGQEHGGQEGLVKPPRWLT